jgi:hypothetical protein
VSVLAWIILPTLGLAAVQSLLAWLAAYENCRYFRSQIRSRDIGAFTPAVRLIVPCKGIDRSFDQTVRGLLAQDYPGYGITFVVESPTDPAYQRLNQLLREPHECAARAIVAGESRGCGQKVHNLLVATAKLPADAEVLAFADSDIVPDADWLLRLVYPLHDPQRGAVTGYRWFVPPDGNWPGIVLSAMNAPIALLCGNHPFNLVWGGSWAIRRQLFERLVADGDWHGALTEDLPATRFVRRAGCRVAYVPACLVASPIRCSWHWMLSFGRRQYLLLRVYMPGLWRLLGLTTFLAQFAFWGGLAAIASGGLGGQAAPAALLLLTTYLSDSGRAVLRQRTAVLRFPLRGRGPWLAALLDVVVHPLLNFGHLCVIASSFGNVMTWRGIRYRLRGPQRTEVLARPRATDDQRKVAAAA